MTDVNLVMPLADDCAKLRDDLIERALPPVWTLDPAEARRLYSEGAALTRGAWLPAVDSIPVDTIDIPIMSARPAARLYVPHAVDDRRRTTIMWLHGGGWVLGDVDAADPTARTAAVATGCTVVSIDYRCAPVSPFPAAVDDALAAADWLLGEGRTLVVAGDSAGGNLAACVAQLRGDHPGLIGQVLVYPATDVAMSSDSYTQFIDGPFLTRRDMEWFYDRYLGSADRRDPRADVATGLERGSAVPAVVLTVGHDPLRDEGIAYAEALAQRGVAVTWIHAPELYHGSFTQAGVLPSSAARVSEVWAAAQEMFAPSV